MASSSSSDENPYEVLGLQVPQTSEEEARFAEDLRRAHRRAALRYHPDKHVRASDAQRKAAEAAYERVRGAFALLSDDKARKAFDELEAVRQAREARLGERNEKRRRMVEALERRERDAAEGRARDMEEAAKKEALAKELERIRRRERAAAKFAASMAEGGADAGGPMETGAAAPAAQARTVRVAWRVHCEEDALRYGVDELWRLFSQFGHVEDVVRRVKKTRGSAIVQMDSQVAASRAIKASGAISDERGDNPLDVVRVYEQPTTGLGGSDGANGSKRADGGAAAAAPKPTAAPIVGGANYESVVLAKMKRAAERQRLAEEMLRREEEEEEEEERERTNGRA